MNGVVLLTGANDLIGGEIAWRLMNAGRCVACLVRSKVLPTFRSSYPWPQIK
jgi:NAD(P)-dependent dehydrogenase (short-subunit alcohol dehydrogenase family)